MVPWTLVRTWESGVRVVWEGYGGRSLTKHDVTSTDEDDVEVVRAADMGNSVHGQWMRTEWDEGRNLSIGMSLAGSMDGLRDENPEE